MFGESVEAELVARCFDAVERARSVVVLGSSLKVMSGYRFVRAAVRAAKPVAMVGLGAMRGEDDADLVLREQLGACLSGVSERMTGQEPSGQMLRRTAVTLPMTEA